MFAIGEHIIHPGQGVCTVLGYEDAPEPMIVLEAKSGHARTKLMYPVSQLDRLHPCIAHDEAEAIVAGTVDIECDPFTERNSSLEEAHFRKQLKLGAPETFRIAKTMRVRIHEAEARSKKPSSYYARIYKEAHRRSVEELAVVLGISEEEVEQRIHDTYDDEGFGKN